MFGNLKEFPKPSGSYVVGITEMNFIDTDRKRIYPGLNDAGRELSVTVYYPADDAQGKISAHYAFPEAFDIISKMSFGMMSKRVTQVKTHCYPDIVISKKHKSYPVIIFNHGIYSYTTQNTVLCSDLASSGYIVLSIGHPFGSGAVKYLDGRIVKVSNELFQNFSKESANAGKVGKVSAVSKATYSDTEVMQVVRAYYDNCPILNKDVQIWVDDTRFIADQLAKMNEGSIPSLFTNKLRLDQGLGITGHSYGGAVAAQTCLQDPRFVCGINIDGGSYGEYRNKDVKKPFMVLGSHLMENMSRTTYLFNSEDTYMTIVGGSAHYGFTDALFCARQLNLASMIGKREMYEFRELVTKYHLQFFKKYLSGNSEVKLSEIKYSDVKFWEKLKS